MAEWRFYEQKPTDPIHNPISGEFFSTEAVGDVTEALIREGVQNTLDAKRPSTDGRRGRVTARIFLSEDAAALPPERARRWFSSLWPHTMAPGNGLRNQPGRDEPCPFLVFEDFGTTGLTGDPGEYRLIEKTTNHFLNFFRAEGHSDKGSEDRGSWGVGKTVFPRASRVGSFFGLTRRDDGRRLLLGRSILKYHRVGDTSYTSDGYFGLGGNEGFMLPTEDTATIDEFRRDFHIARQHENGLSVVVPWYDRGDDGVTREKIVNAVLRGFFYPILMGDLSVVIGAPSGEISLDGDSIFQTIKALGGELERDLLPLAELALWAQTRLPGEFVSLLAPPPEDAQKWSSDLLSPQVVERIRQSLAQRQRLALRVPLYAQKRDEPPRETFFNVFLEHSDEDRSKPVFIRDELIILDVQAPRTPQVRSLVIVEDQPLATLLRDAETPAHTQWNQGTGNFKDKYKFGPGVIKFVRLGVHELLAIVNQAEQEPDPSITIDFFSVPVPPEDDEAVPARRRKPKEVPGDGVPPGPGPFLPVGPRRFRIEKLRGGFGIRPGDEGAPLPPLLDIRVAYDVRRGKSLKKYHPADFDLAKEPIRQDANDGLSVVSADENRMLVKVTAADFHLDVTGFDPDRDLYVKAEAKELADVDQAN